MKFQIVFENSGDTINFASINHELLEYYVNWLNLNKWNSFSIQNKSWCQDVSRRIDRLHKQLESVNTWIEELTDCRCDVFEWENYLNQDNLNKLHADWVRSQGQIYDINAKRQQYNFSGTAEHIHNMFSDDERFVTIGNLLVKLNKMSEYIEINSSIHALETSFDELQFSAAIGSWQQITNIFDKSILTNNFANLNLTLSHLGRTLYDKFVSFDLDLKHDDENSFDELLGNIDISLLPPQTIPLSIQYQEWCHAHGREPIGNNLNLGNIPDLHNRLTHYRQLIFKNLKSNNNFFIHIT